MKEILELDDMHLVDLLSHAERISKIADSYGATNLAVFGSVARNQAYRTVMWIYLLIFPITQDSLIESP